MTIPLLSKKTKQNILPSAAVGVCEAPHKATGASGQAGARAGAGPTTEINTPRFRWGGADKPHANRMWCLTQLEKAEESRRCLPMRPGLDGAEEEPVILFFFIFGEPPDGVEGGATSSLASLFPVCEIGVRV